MSTKPFTADHPARVVFPSISAPRGSKETEGFTRGHAAGYAAGLRKAEVQNLARLQEMEAEHVEALETGRRQVAAVVAVLESAARALHARTSPVLAHADAQLAAAALELAEAILGRELSDAPAAARSALKRALSGPDSTAVIEVRLNPADLAMLPVDAAGCAALVGDPSIAPGDAVAHYPDGELDARIGTSLARAREALLGQDA